VNDYRFFAFGGRLYKLHLPRKHNKKRNVLVALLDKHMAGRELTRSPLGGKASNLGRRQRGKQSLSLLVR
jgi:hypothetical protein